MSLHAIGPPAAIKPTSRADESAEPPPDDPDDERSLFDRRFWLLNAAIWSLVSCTSAGAQLADLARSGRQAVPWKTFAYYFAVYLPWFLTTPLVFRATQRLSKRRRDLRLALDILGLLILWGAFYVAAQALVLSMASYGTAHQWLTALRSLQLSQLLLDSIYLLALVAFALSTLQTHEARRRERQANRLSLENAELSTHLAEARLQMLQAQLEPHFLYNALNSIASLIRHGEKETAAGAVGLLSELLRYATRATTRDWVTLGEEVDFAEAYWGFQQIRYGSRLDCVYEIDEELAAAPVPPLVLQPLLENAIRHGIETLEGDGRARLTVKQQHEVMKIEVANSPAGVPAPVQDRSSQGFGVGLRNVEERLRWMFKGAGELKLRRRDPEMVAELTLPRMAPDR